MDFGVLGPLEVLEEGQALRLGGHKQRAVLASLLLHANEVVSADALIEVLWGGTPPDRARATLHVYVSNLRRLLGPYIGAHAQPRLARRPPGYQLRVADDELDRDRFTRLTAEGRAALSRRDPRLASTFLRSALELWRGPAFPDLVHNGMAPPEVGALEEQRLSVLEARVDADLERGCTGELVAELDSLVATHPLRERLQAQRMLALYRDGRQAEALEAYRAARTVLRDELGVDPGPALRRLERQVLQQSPELDPPVLTTRARSLLPLPAPTNRLIGRDHELATLAALLRDEQVRQVSLLGPAGSGKTRLGLEVARSLESEFAGGVVFVPLAPLTDPRLVLPTIASTLGVKETAERPLAELVRDALEGLSTLFVLDNFEHVLPAAGQVAELVTAASQLKVLVTSRARLRVSFEWEYPVAPMPLRRSIRCRRCLGCGTTTQSGCSPSGRAPSSRDSK